MKNNIKEIVQNLNWLFFILAFIALIIGTIFLPLMWKIINAGILISLSILIVFNTLRTQKSNASLRIEQQRLTNIVENLRDGIIVYDENFTILVFNKASEQIFSLSRGEIIKKSFTLKLKEEASPRFKTLLAILFPALAPMVVRRSEPGTYPQIIDISFTDPALELTVSTNQIKNDTGRVIGFIKVIHDRTRELELLRSKSEFITIASHQLRTPLSGANWALESLKKEELSENQKSMVNNTIGAINRLLKITNDLLDVAKIEEGNFGYTFQEVDMVRFLTDAVNQARPIASQYKTQLYFEEPQEKPITITADAQKLGMVLSSIIDNAIKYNIPNGQVVVNLRRIPNKSFIQVSIKDTGIGIPQNEFNKLFTRFFRAQNALKAQVEGTGLGLYIAKNIIRRHGGKIWAESAENRGSTFHFTLPTNPALIPSKEFIYGE